jgi:hypothetical protein
MNFASFKIGKPAGVMFRKLELEEFLESAQSWRSLQALIVHYNSYNKGDFVALARRCDGAASSGERVLLHAILYATDFAWLADELTAGRAWQRMNNADEEWRQAVAACIAQAEEPERNANLIDAAPDLLAACELFTNGARDSVQALNAMGHACPASIPLAADKARVAIAKAGGTK